MTEHEIRVQIHAILNSHDEALAAMRRAHGAMDKAWEAHREASAAHDDALVSAIEANRAALRMLNRIMDEGVQPDA